MHHKLLKIFIGRICTIFLVPIIIFLDASDLLSDENLNSAITKVYGAMSDTRQLMVHIEHLWIGQLGMLCQLSIDVLQRELSNTILRNFPPRGQNLFAENDRSVP